MKQYHLRHHYLSEKSWFGVSNPWLDLVFGTFPNAGEVQKSADDAQALLLRRAWFLHGARGENSGDGVERDDSGNGRPARRGRARR